MAAKEDKYAPETAGTARWPECRQERRLELFAVRLPQLWDTSQFAVQTCKAGAHCQHVPRMPSLRRPLWEDKHRQNKKRSSLKNGPLMLSGFLSAVARGEGCSSLIARGWGGREGVQAKLQGWRLQMAGPLRILSDASWAKTCLQARRDKGLLDEWGHERPMMLAPLPGGGWTMRPLAIGEAALWGSGGGKIKTHSLKATLLSWAGVDIEQRKLLGYHVLQGQESALTYSRDAMAAPLCDLEKVLAKVRGGSFRPDLTRSGYV
eukprot:1357424-Amphidinium_carterae.1